MHHNARATNQVIREPGERMAPDAIQKKHDKGPTEIHVWAAIGYNFKSKLIFYGIFEGDLTKSNMTLGVYCDKILPYVISIRDQYGEEGREMVFQEDGDRGHGNALESNICRMYKNEHSLNYWDDWPPNSPDLSPIENIWRIIKQRVKQHRPKDAEELRYWWNYEWDRLSQDKINKYILGEHYNMRKQLQQCIARKGLQTEF